MTRAAPGPRLHVGGSIREEAVYVERHADSELLAALRRGEICHVLAPRQMGKSSLCGRAARLLRKDGVTCIQIDLNLLGGRKSVADIDSWFFSLIKELSRQLGWPRDFTDELWRSEAQTTATYKWSRFLHEEVPARIPGPVVFIFDEIDTILTLPFSCDDFFAVVRAMHNARPERPELRRIAVCFVGVAAPGELMVDAARTPLNVGTAISLVDFSRAEADGFLPALAAHLPGPADWLDAIYDWTSGHPYMTHKLCAELCKQPPGVAIPAERVEEVVRRSFLQNGRVSETNLQYAERRIDAHTSSNLLLRMYRRLLEGQSIPADRNDPLQSELWLSGICRWHQGCLGVRNRIFAVVFDWAWAHGKESARLLDEALQRWLDAGKHPGQLLGGAALEAARSWAEGRSDVSAEEQEFLLASLQAARVRSSRRALQVAVGSLATALVTCIALFIWQLGVWRNKNEAEKQLRELAELHATAQRRSAEELRKGRDLEMQLREKLQASLDRQRAMDAVREQEILQMKQLIAGSQGCTELLRRQSLRDSQEEKEHLRRFEAERAHWDQLSGGSAPTLSPEASELQRAIAGFQPPSPPAAATKPPRPAPKHP